MTFYNNWAYNKYEQRGLLDGLTIKVAVVRAVRPTGWHDHQSGSGNSGESYREGFYPTKVEVDGLFI